jgi:hypothetical protein
MENLNSYKKFAPNVFVAKCHEQNEKGETVIITTKYGQEHENEIHNYLGKTADDFYLYSITRCDGFNSQERAKKKAEKLSGYASNAEKRSNEAYKKSDMSESATGIPFGQPILVGHHSERRHRKTLERASRAMDKTVEESNKAEDYKSRAEYWINKASKINLSMPESLEFYEFKLEEAIKNHKFLKDNPSERRHGYSLTYANKTVKETRNNLNLAVRLWGSDEVIKQIADEKKEKAEAEAGKSKKKTDIVLKYGGFFAFNNDQLKSGHAKILEAGHIEKGEKVSHLKHGLYIPSKNVDAFLKEL